MSWPRARRSVLHTSALGLLLAACTGAAGAPEPPPTALSSSFGAETAAPGSPEPDVVIASAPLPSEAAATQAAPAACTADVDCAEGSICEGTACAPSCPDGLPASVFFERDAPSPGPSEEPSLDAIAACMRAYRTRRLLLTGLMANEPICEGRGACRRLTPEYAMGLGARLTRSVRQALGERGVERSRMSERSVGIELATCTEDTPACYDRDRRVDVTWAP